MQPNVPHVDVIVAEAKARDAGIAAVIATDIVGTIVYWNDHAVELYGWPSHEAIGRNVLDVTPTYTSAEEAARIMEQLRRGESWTGEFIAQRRDGERIMTHVTDLPVIAGTDVVGVVGVSRAERRGGPRTA
ncbi:MAG: domain S-box [Gemmatimonadetes bacterium]|nr:domain S-box [Gemmatimonadota bacterium]